MTEEPVPSLHSGQALSTAKELTWTPRIIAFCCHHCAYAAADLAGGLRIQYPPSIKVFELPCTGKLDVLHVLHTFEAGADGVFAAG